MGTFLSPIDLDPFASIDLAKAEAMIDDAEAMAVLAAPCISTTGFAYGAAVKAILRGAILRWHESGTGALQSKTVGAFSETYDTRQERRPLFWPTEITALQNLCADGSGSAYTLSMAGPDVTTADATQLLGLTGWH